MSVLKTYLEEKKKIATESSASEEHSNQNTESLCHLESDGYKGMDGPDLQIMPTIKTEDLKSGEDSNQSFCFEMPLEVELGNDELLTPPDCENPPDPIETVYVKTEPAAEEWEPSELILEPGVSDPYQNEGCGSSQGWMEIPNNKRPPMDPAMVRSELVEGRKTHCCQLCPYQTPHSTNIRLHLATHTVRKREKTAKVTGGCKVHYCEICSYKSTKSCNLKKHLLMHSGRRPIKCELCDFSCTTTSDLNRHKRIHSGERPFVCGECGCGFTQSVHLKNHVLGIHSDVKSFSCQQCDYKTALKKYLTSHVSREHLGQWPYSCAHCQYRTTSKPDLIKHMAKHRSIGSSIS